MKQFITRVFEPIIYYWVVFLDQRDLSICGVRSDKMIHAVLINQFEIQPIISLSLLRSGKKNPVI